MKKMPSNDAFNIIMNGAWNPAIFSPEWAKKHLSDNPDKDVVLALPMQLNLPMRLTVDGVNIYPSAQSLMIDAIEYERSSFNECIGKIKKISKLLPHTPVSAIGVNFRLEFFSAECPALSSLFSFDDAAKIDANQFKLVGAGIRRSYKVSDDTIMNLMIELRDDVYRCEFNFHTQANDLDSVALKISISEVQGFQKMAHKFLVEVYGLELDNG